MLTPDKTPVPQQFSIPDWPRVNGQLDANGRIRRRPEDFCVVEQLGFEPSGHGEHILLKIQKTGLNTEQVANSIARLAGVRKMAIGYAGLKDRNAVTSQWFSVNLQGKAQPDWSELENDNISLLCAEKHHRKLRRGAHSGNLFSIRLTDLKGEEHSLEKRLQLVRNKGVPNYFGEQRFGRGGENLLRAEAMFSGERDRIKRHLRGLYISAARSFLFNQVLAYRVTTGSWDQACPGDVMILDGRRGFFTVTALDDELTERVMKMQVHPTGPLWGAKGIWPKDDILKIEQQVVLEYQNWCEALVKMEIEADRRALRSQVNGLEWQFQGNELQLDFSLAKGCYATAVLRELVSYQ